MQIEKNCQLIYFCASRSFIKKKHENPFSFLTFAEGSWYYISLVPHFIQWTMTGSIDWLISWAAGMTA